MVARVSSNLPWVSFQLTRGLRLFSMAGTNLHAHSSSFTAGDTLWVPAHSLLVSLLSVIPLEER